MRQLTEEERNYIEECRTIHSRSIERLVAIIDRLTAPNRFGGLEEVVAEIEQLESFRSWMLVSPCIRPIPVEQYWYACVDFEQRPEVEAEGDTPAAALRAALEKAKGEAEVKAE